MGALERELLALQRIRVATALDEDAAPQRHSVRVIADARREERVGEWLPFGIDVGTDVDAPAPEVERLTQAADVGRGFVDLDLDIGVGERVRGREAGGPTPEHRDSLRSGSLRSVTSQMPAPMWRHPVPRARAEGSAHAAKPP